MTKGRRGHRGRALLKAAKGAAPMVAGMLLLSACEQSKTISNPKAPSYDMGMEDVRLSPDTSNPKGSLYDVGFDATGSDATPDARPDVALSIDFSNPKGSLFDAGLMDPDEGTD